MSNVFTTAFEARIETATANEANASNLKKLRMMRDRCANKEFAKLLRASKVDADRFSRAIYASEKVIKFAYQAIETNVKELNENTYAIFRTALNCAAANVSMTKYDAECAISRDLKVADDKTALVFSRSKIQTAETIAAQSQTSIDALKTLNILADSTEQRNAYTINVTELALAIAHKLKIDISAFEQTEEESAVEEVAA